MSDMCGSAGPGFVGLIHSQHCYAGRSTHQLLFDINSKDALFNTLI